MNDNVIASIYYNLNSIGALFKPGQRRIIEKLSKGTQLNENEKRYLRGKLGEKISAIEILYPSEPYGIQGNGNMIYSIRIRIAN